MSGVYTVLALLTLGISLSQGSGRFETDDFCCSVNDDCFPSQSKILAFDKKIKGSVILPDMYEYRNVSHMYNTVEQRSPSMVVMVETVNDIRDAILFAREYNLRVTVRSTGHDYSGRSTWEGSLNINLAKMKDYSVNLDSTRHPDGEIKVQTGLQWIEIYKLLHSYDRVIVGGSAKTVSPGGYTLGGGHSPISRSYGYAVDNLLEIQVVLPDGRIATCTKTRTVIESISGSKVTVSNGDLFWAMSGGGGGTYGVVVYFVFKLHPAPSGMVLLNTYIPIKIQPGDTDHTANVFELIKGFSTLPAEWGGYYILKNHNVTFKNEETGLGFDLYTTGSLELHINKLAPWDGTEKTVFASLVEFCKTNAIPYTFSNISSFFDYASLAYDPPVIRTYLANTLVQPENLIESFANMIHDELFVNDLSKAWVQCTGVLLGRKTTQFGVDTTPLHPGYRTAFSSLTCGVGLSDGYTYPSFHQAENDEKSLPAINKFGERLRAFGKGMYLNEPMKSNSNWRQDFWGDEHYERLLEIKEVYDPDNFFTCHHCVGSELKASTAVNGASTLVCSSLAVFLLAIACIFVLT